VKKLGSTGKFLVKLVISAVLMAFLVKKISLAHVHEIISSLNGGTLLAAAVVFFISNCLGALQWHLLLTAGGVELAFARTFRFYFVGLFFNNFLPANIGGDAVKIYDVSRMGSDVYKVAAVTILDRVLGIFSLCLLASVAAMSRIRSGADGAIWVYLAIFLGCMIPAVGFYMVKPLGRALRRSILAIRIFRVNERLTQLLDHLGGFKGRYSLICPLIALSIVIQGLRVTTHILVASAVGIEIGSATIVQFFVFIPILSLAMIPPVTVNGLGVREGLGMVLFRRAGILKTEAFMIEFTTYLVSVTVSLLGWVFFVTRKSVSREDV
jgi:hypothetical protein